MDGGEEVTVAGVTLVALPAPALWWPAKKTLLVADLHLGKAASFRAASVAAPAGTTRSTLDRLASVVEDVAPLRLILLGDLWHSHVGRTPERLNLLRSWCRKWIGIEVLLIEGNHDRRSGAANEDECGTVVHGSLADGPFVFRHEPESVPGGYVIAGHLHPAIRLSGRGRQSMRLPCFWFGREVGVLPAFGDFTGSTLISPQPGDQVLVVAGAKVMGVSDRG